LSFAEEDKRRIVTEQSRDTVSSCRESYKDQLARLIRIVWDFGPAGRRISHAMAARGCTIGGSW